MPSSIQPYIGKEYKFDDGRSIKIISETLRDVNEVEWYIVYEVKYSTTSIPKRMLMAEKEFISFFSHLFFDKPQS